MMKKPRDRDTVESVVRAVRIIESFSRHRPRLSVAELVDATGLSRTTIYRLAGTLESTGWLSRHPDGSYSLGMRVFRMGTIAVSQLDIHRIARPVMEHLADVLGESSYLFIDDNGRALCIERVIGRAPIKVTMIDVGQALPEGSGAAYLVFRAWPPVNDSSHLANSDAMVQRLAEVKQCGYAANLDEVAEGVSAIMVPIWNYDNVAIAALGIGGLSSRFTEAAMPKFVSELKKAAQRIRSDLYGSEAGRSR